MSEGAKLPSPDAVRQREVSIITLIFRERVILVLPFSSSTIKNLADRLGKKGTVVVR